MALIDKETIRAEIERLKYKISIGLSEYDMGYENGMGETCNDLLAFLDTLPEQPVEGLEKEIDDYIEGCLGGLEGQEIASCARYFYELGCTRTAVMYDDIEYNRQRAEEAELSGDLEEEVKRYWNAHALEYRIGRVADIDFLQLAARHFAEWGIEEGERQMMENARA